MVKIILSSLVLLVSISRSDTYLNIKPDTLLYFDSAYTLRLVLENQYEPCNDKQPCQLRLEGYTIKNDIYGKAGDTISIPFIFSSANYNKSNKALGAGETTNSMRIFIVDFYGTQHAGITVKMSLIPDTSATTQAGQFIFPLGVRYASQNTIRVVVRDSACNLCEAFICQYMCASVTSAGIFKGAVGDTVDLVFNEPAKNEVHGKIDSGAAYTFSYRDTASSDGAQIGIYGNNRGTVLFKFNTETTSMLKKPRSLSRSGRIDPSTSPLSNTLGREVRETNSRAQFIKAPTVLFYVP